MFALHCPSLMKAKKKDWWDTGIAGVRASSVQASPVMPCSKQPPVKQIKNKGGGRVKLQCNAGKTCQPLSLQLSKQRRRHVQISAGTWELFKWLFITVPCLLFRAQGTEEITKRIWWDTGIECTWLAISSSISMPQPSKTAKCTQQLDFMP